jgi:hypothetical protein
VAMPSLTSDIRHPIDPLTAMRPQANRERGRVVQPDCHGGRKPAALELSRDILSPFRTRIPHGLGRPGDNAANRDILVGDELVALTGTRCTRRWGEQRMTKGPFGSVTICTVWKDQPGSEAINRPRLCEAMSYAIPASVEYLPACSSSCLGICPSLRYRVQLSTVLITLSPCRSSLLP